MKTIFLALSIIWMTIQYADFIIWRIDISDGTQYLLGQIIGTSLFALPPLILTTWYYGRKKQKITTKV